MLTFNDYRKLDRNNRRHLQLRAASPAVAARFAKYEIAIEAEYLAEHAYLTKRVAACDARMMELDPVRAALELA